MSDIPESPVFRVFGVYGWECLGLFSQLLRLYHVPFLPLLASFHYQGVVFLVGSFSVSLGVLWDARSFYILVQLV